MSLPDTASGNGTAAPPPDPGSGCDVTMPSGARFPVMNEDEADYVAERVDRYQTAYRLSDISDQQDLDQIIIDELLIQRWSQWLARGEDYYGGPIDDARIRKDRTEMARELRLRKKSMGMDKVARERTSGKGSVDQYITNLLARAKLFGYHRNNQAAKAMELINELIGMVTFSRNASPEERIEHDVTPDDVLEWIWNRMRVEYEELDRAFREGEQKMWVRDQ